MEIESLIATWSALIISSVWFSSKHEARILMGIIWFLFSIFIVIISSNK